MGKIAFLFPGQGAQYPGMGKDLYDNFEVAKKLFDEAEQIRPGTLQQCFEADKEELSITSTTQPCLYCVDLAAAFVLKDAGINASAVAGFSLGEVAALSFAGAYSFRDGFEFVCKRGELMQKEADKIDSGMAAVLKLEASQVEEIAKKYEQVYPVNYNSDGQIVVAGLKSSIGPFTEEIKQAGGRCMPLAVSGGFHSPFMDEAAENLKAEIEKISMSQTKIPVYANRNGLPYEGDYVQTLTEQINHPVLWKDTIETMSNNGIDTFIEVGAGNVLSNLVKRIVKDVAIYQVENKESLDKTLEQLK